MPNLATIVRRVFLHQTLLYWQKTGSDKFGKPAYLNPTSPVVLQCRWEEKPTEVLASDGRKVMAKGYILMVDRLIPGSLIFLGSLTDWQALPTYPNVPTVGQGGAEVLTTHVTPDVKNQSTIFENYV